MNVHEERIKQEQQEQLEKKEQERIKNQKTEAIISTMSDEEKEKIKNIVMENITISKDLITDKYLDNCIFEYVKNNKLSAVVI